MARASRNSVILLCLAATVGILLQIFGMFSLSYQQVIIMPQTPLLGSVVRETPSYDFMLIRPIGNALPPRHHPNQTYNNLKFIVENEVKDPGLKKHWLLNRIVDIEVVKKIIELLEQHDQSYSVEPFILEEYAKKDFVLLRHRNTVDMIHSPSFQKQSDWTQRMTISSVYEPKTLYVMNVNEVRNKLIEIGIASGARWILPWDQNCFLTEQAWAKVKQDVIAKAEETKYFVTWMDRIHGKNEDLLKPHYQPNPWEEPQVIFRSDALERFDEALRYGRRDKAALLVRLNVPGDWWKWGWDAWERKRSFENMSLDVNSTVPKAGWVARLNSGNSKVEKKGTGRERELLRSFAVTNMLDRLDEMALYRVHKYSNKSLVFYDRQEVDDLKTKYQKARKEGKSSLLAQQIVSDAEKAMEFGPWSVVDKPEAGPSFDKHDFFSMLLPQRYGDQSEEDPYTADVFDTERFLDFAYNTTALAFGWHVTGNMKYAKKATKNIITWFVNVETRMKPRMSYAGIHPGTAIGTNQGIIELTSLYFLLDAIHLINESGALSTSDYDAIQDWMKEYLKWLLKSEQGQSLFLSTSRRGLLFDIQLSAVAAFVNDTKLFIKHSSTVRSRLISIFSPSGRLIAKDNNAPPSTLIAREALHHWSVMSLISRKVGVSVWNYLEKIEGKSALCLAAAGHTPCCNDDVGSCAYLLGDTEEMHRWAPIAYVGVQYCSNLRERESCRALATHVSSDPSFARSQRFPPYLSFQEEAFAPKEIRL